MDATFLNEVRVNITGFDGNINMRGISSFNDKNTLFCSLDPIRLVHSDSKTYEIETVESIGTTIATSSMKIGDKSYSIENNRLYYVNLTDDISISMIKQQMKTKTLSSTYVLLQSEQGYEVGDRPCLSEFF